MPFAVLLINDVLPLAHQPLAVRQDALGNIAEKVAALEARLLETSAKRAHALKALRRSKDECGALRRQLKVRALRSACQPAPCRTLALATCFLCMLYPGHLY